jgi:small GTP-binding protein
MTDRVKVVLVGESGVGKSCIIVRFVQNKFDPNTMTSSTNQMVYQTIKLPDDKSVDIILWDTMGQERYRSMNKIYYKNAKVGILVYDVTDKKSFEAIKNYWYEQLKESGDKDIIICLVANKYDLYEKREVSNEEGEEFAKSIGAIFASTSAKNDSGINFLFENIGRKILEPDFDFFAAEQKKKDDYKKKKKKEDEENNKAINNKNNNANKIVKLNTQKEKKKKCC